MTEYEYWYDPIGNTKIVWNSKTGSIVKTDFNGDSVIQPAFFNQTDPAVGAPILNETGDTVISCYLRESLVLTGICQSDAPRMTSDKEPDLTDTGIFLPLSMAKEGIYPDRISPDMSEYEYWYDSDGTVKMIWNSNTGSAVRKDASGDSMLVAAFNWNAVDDPQGIILQAKPTSTFPRSMKSAPKTRITLEQFDHLMDICGIRSLHDVLAGQYDVLPDVQWGGDFSNYEYWLDDHGETVVLVRPYECVVTVLSGTRYGLPAGNAAAVTKGWNLDSLSKEAMLSEQTYRRTVPNNSIVFKQSDLRITFDQVKDLCEQCSTPDELYALLENLDIHPDVVQGSGTTFVEYWADDYCSSMIRFYLNSGNNIVIFISGLENGCVTNETGEIPCEILNLETQEITESTIWVGLMIRK